MRSRPGSDKNSRSGKRSPRTFNRRLDGDLARRAADLSRYFNMLARPDLPGMAFDQFAHLSDRSLATELPHSVTTNHDLTGSMPQILEMRDLAIEYSGDSFQTILPVFYRQGADYGVEQLAILACDAWRDGLSIISDLHYRGVNYERIPEPDRAPDHPGLILDARPHQGLVWVELREDWWSAFELELPALAEERRVSPIALIAIYANPRVPEPAKLLSTETDLLRAGRESCAQFSGAHAFVLSLMPALLDPSYSFNANRANLSIERLLASWAPVLNNGYMAERDSDNYDIVSSIVEQVQYAANPLGRLVLLDSITQEVTEALQNEMFRAAREHREGGGTWREIGDAFGVTPQAAQSRFDPAGRKLNAERSRRRRDRQSS